MEKLTSISRQIVKRVRHVVTSTLAEAMGPLGLKVEALSGQYDEGSFTLKLRFTLEGFDRGKKDFVDLAQIYGLKPSDHGRIFTVGGTEYQLTSINSRRPKYPFGANRVSDGAGFKFGEDTVLRAFGVEIAAPTGGLTLHDPPPRSKGGK